MVLVTPLSDAVRVTASVDDTAEAEALKLAVVAPEATVTVAGIVKSLVLLERDTTTGLDGGALRETEHDVVVGPVNA